VISFDVKKADYTKIYNLFYIKMMGSDYLKYIRQGLSPYYNAHGFSETISYILEDGTHDQELRVMRPSSGTFENEGLGGEQEYDLVEVFENREFGGEHEYQVEHFSIDGEPSDIILSIYENDVEEILYEIGFNYTINILRDGKSVFSTIVDYTAVNTPESWKMITESVTKYGELFPSPEECATPKLFPMRCFRKERTKTDLFVNKTEEVLGVINPFTFNEIWEHDGVVTMRTILALHHLTTDTKESKLLSLDIYLPFHLPRIMKSETLTATTVYHWPTSKWVVKSNYQDIRVVYDILNAGYELEILREGTKFLVVDVAFLNDTFIIGNLEAYYVRETDSLMDKALCTGLNCFRKVHISSEYEIDFEQKKLKSDVTVFSSAVDEERELEEKLSNDPFMGEIKRFSQALDRLQHLDDEVVEERIDEVKEKRILFNVDLREKSVVYDETTETDDHRVARVEWTDKTITFNSADKETNAEFKLDWHNPERPMMGFLATRRRNMPTYEKVFEQVSDGDLSILTDPATQMTSVSGGSCYAVGFGPEREEAHFLMGRIYQFSPDRISIPEYIFE